MVKIKKIQRDTLKAWTGDTEKKQEEQVLTKIA